MIHHKTGCHQRRRQQHIGGIIHRILLAGSCCAQQADHWFHEDGAKHRQHTAKEKCQKECRRKHLTCLLLITLAQQSGNIAVCTNSQHRAAHHNELIQRCVYADSRGGAVTQTTDKIGIRQGIDGADQKRHNGGDRHFGDHPGNGLVEHHRAALLLMQFLIFHSNPAPYLLSFYCSARYFSACIAAMAPSAAAVITWRKVFTRISPAANTPGIWVFISSSVRT